MIGSVYNRDKDIERSYRRVYVYIKKRERKRKGLYIRKYILL